MSEDFRWVNIDRKEYLDPTDFDYSGWIHGSMQRKSKVLKALRELLANEWKGSRIVWLGDGSGFLEEPENDLFKLLYKHTEEFGYPGDVLDTVVEFYKNVSCQFVGIEKEVIELVEFYLSDLRENRVDTPNVYFVDPKNPYEGMFKRKGMDFKYIINMTKNVCYSLKKTKILHQNGQVSKYFDPLPILLGYGLSYDAGPWIGDVVEVANEIDNNVLLLDSITLDW